MALGSSFLCGCFVPFNYMPDYVIKLAHILPTYYFVSNNELIKNMEIFDFINVKQLGINIFIIIVYSLIFVVLTNFISKKNEFYCNFCVYILKVKNTHSFDIKSNEWVF